MAERITQALRIPTIGIGAGAECAGQVLVWHDLLGINEGRAPKFVKRFAAVADRDRGAAWRHSPPRCGRARIPAEEHTYPISDEEFALFESEVAPGVLVADDWL